MSDSVCVFEALNLKRSRRIQEALAAAGIPYILDHRTSFGKPIERAQNLIVPIRILVDQDDANRAREVVALVEAGES